VPHRVGVGVVVADHLDRLDVATVDAQPPDRPSGTAGRHDGEEGEVKIGVAPLPPARGRG
jgi:hypothetical protein